jgi:hypothetical protein
MAKKTRDSRKGNFMVCKRRYYESGVKEAMVPMYTLREPWSWDPGSVKWVPVDAPEAPAPEKPLVANLRDKVEQFFSALGR